MSDSQKSVRWGIIGPGGIAQAFAGGLKDSQSGHLAAIASRNPSNPNLEKNFPGIRVVDGYQNLIDDPDIDAIYIATPHPGHAEWGIKAAEGGKHVLCEKPIGLTAYEADAMFNAARRAGTFMGEAFMYRLHPQTLKIVELIKSGRIGDVRKIQSSFGFQIGFDPKHRLLANDLAGGGILDVGCYPASMVRLIAGADSGVGFVEPISVAGAAHLGETGVDEWASALLTFPKGILAEISCSVSLNQDNVLRVYGSKGRIEVPDFWFAGFKGDGVGHIEVIANDGAHETIETHETLHLYSFEAESASQAILAGKTEFASPGMSWDDSLGNLRLLDKWRRDIGLSYAIEKPSHRKATLRGDKLSVGPNPIDKITVAGLAHPISKVALGFEDFPDFASSSVLLDSFFEQGGNLFDTAHIYGNGQAEKNLGDWHTARGLKRNEIVVIGKGAHSPQTYPDVIGKQLDESLDRLQTDYVDVYFMHRDNEDIPVGEFIDAMDAEVQRGRIRGLFGGSNWTKERLQQGMDYAKRAGKTAPGALSNNFSLADMIEPIWEGCISASDATFKNWLVETQMPNFAWSSQGRGFFTPRAGRDKLDNQELVRTWYSDSNFERRDRALQLAEELGCSPLHIALAYVLAQPFPVVPLIGPRHMWELDDSLSALNIALTPQQVVWLETGAE